MTTTSLRKRRVPILGSCAGLALAAAGTFACLGCHQIEVYGFRVVRTYDHDPAAYCQGLVFDAGELLESTGREGQSSVRIVELETGKVLKKERLPPDLFGEGLALVDGELFQLTWEEGIARVYDRTTLAYLREFEYTGEGWGLAYDGEHLIQSDGSEVLRVRDPKTFEVIRRIHVEVDGQPVLKLNELEMVEGEIFANIWKTDYIARIDPRSGRVLGYIDLGGLFDPSKIPDEDAVLNGIAYDPAKKRLFVTGKLWPKLYEIEIVEK